jgi:hypothetical protein
MSTETAIAVELPVDDEVADLLRDVGAAHRRAEKSEPGERPEVVSYEALSSALELRAARALFDGSGTRVSMQDRSGVTADLFARNEGAVVVMLTLPLEQGALIREATGKTAPMPAGPVEIRDDIWGRRLVLERFRAQLDNAISEPGKDRASVLNPSGVHNRVLTEVLREYVERQGKTPISVPVVYRDGSRSSADFPFHRLDLVTDISSDDEAMDKGALLLRLALLSIRHTQMDAVVDGAWLRNAEVSKPRPAAQTDDYVYHKSIGQLDELTSGSHQKVRLYIYQTGLETAVVGFFRAVVEFLGNHPGRLEVVPMFYVKHPDDDAHVGGEFAGYEPGDAWATKEGSW